MKIARLFLLGLLCIAGAATLPAQVQIASTTVIVPPTSPPGEYVLVSGGPTLMVWEKYKTIPHDNFWGGFIRAARTRIQQIRMQDPNGMITWLVYLDGYRARGKQDQQDLLSNIYSVRDKYHLNLVPIANGRDIINYLNGGQNRDRLKVVDFEYFGHSNRACFMLDYSNNIDSASKAWLHEDELVQLHRNIFAKNAFVKSWGCHTGESMNKKFYAATGTHMIGAIGRTDYSNRDEALNGVIPVLSSAGGQWVQ